MRLSVCALMYMTYVSFLYVYTFSSSHLISPQWGQVVDYCKTITPNKEMYVCTYVCVNLSIHACTC